MLLQNVKEAELNENFEIGNGVSVFVMSMKGSVTL